MDILQSYKNAGLMLYMEEVINTHFDNQVIRFNEDFSSLNISANTISVYEMYKKDTQSIAIGFSMVAKKVQKELKKHGIVISDLGYIFADIEDKLGEVLDTYNKVLSSAFNEASYLGKQVEYEADAFKFGIITNSFCSSAAFAVAVSLNQLGKDVRAYRQQHQGQAEFVMEFQKKWKLVFSETILPYAEVIYGEARSRLIESCCGELDIDYNEYCKWKENISQATKKEIMQQYSQSDSTDKRQRLINIYQIEHKKAQAELIELQQQSVLARIKYHGEISRIKARIRDIESEIGLLTNCKAIPNGFTYTLKTETVSASAPFQSAQIYGTMGNHDTSLRLDYDDVQKCYHAIHDKAGEIGCLGVNFTQEFGAYRDLSGEIVHWDNPVVSGGNGPLSSMMIRPNVQITIYEN